MNNSSWYAHVHTHINAYKYNCMHTHIHVCCSIQKIYTAGEKWFSIRRRQSSSGTTRIRTRVSQGQTTCLLINHLSCSGSILQTWTGQPVPMMSEHSAHLTPLSRLTENKARQFDPFVVIAGTVSCRNDNLRVPPATTKLTNWPSFVFSRSPLTLAINIFDVWWVYCSLNP